MTEVTKPKTILVEATSFIGDAVWMMWTLTALRQNFPEASIAVKPPKDNWAGKHMLAPELGVSVDAQADPEKFDFFLHHHTNDISHQFFGEAPQPWARQMTFTRESPAPTKHVIEAQLKKLQEIFPGFVLPEKPIMAKPETFEGLPEGFTDRPFVSIHTSSSCPEKVYPIEQWEKAAELIVKRGFNVVFIGGPTDPNPTIENKHILNLVGKTSLAQTTGVIAASTVQAAADTGSGHIGAAYGVPVVSLFGGFTYPVSCCPYSAGADVIVIKEQAGQSPVPSMSPAKVARAIESLARRSQRQQKRLAL